MWLTVSPELQAFLQKVEDKISEARLALIMQDCFAPVLVIADSEAPGGVGEQEIDLSVIDKDTLSNIMKDACSNPRIKAMALILDAFTLVRDLKDVQDLPETISQEADTVEAIVSFLYLGAEKTYIRRCPYHKKQEGYWFADLEWMDLPQTEGRFANPFPKV